MRGIATVLTMIALAVIAPTFARAACDDIVTSDDPGVDVGKVTTAARQLAGEGIIVRIRVVAKLQAAERPEDAMASIAQSCNWVSGGRLLSSMLFVFLPVESGQIRTWTGGATNQRLPASFINGIVIPKYMTPYWKARDREPGALTQGLVNMVQALRAELARPLSSGGNTTIINQSASDNSWLKWLVIGVLLLAVVVVSLMFVPQLRRDRSNAVSAQAQARSARSRCIGLLNELGDSDMATELNVAAQTAQADLAPEQVLKLRGDINEFNRLVRAANTMFIAFDSFDRAKDPIKSGLDQRGYESLEQKYESILVNQLEPAKELADKIKDPTRQAYKKAA